MLIKCSVHHNANVKTKLQYTHIFTDNIHANYRWGKENIFLYICSHLSDNRLKAKVHWVDNICYLFRDIDTAEPDIDTLFCSYRPRWWKLNICTRNINKVCEKHRNSRFWINCCCVCRVVHLCMILGMGITIGNKSPQYQGIVLQAIRLEWTCRRFGVWYDFVLIYILRIPFLHVTLTLHALRILELWISTRILIITYVHVYRKNNF